MEYHDRITTPSPAQGFSDSSVGANRLAVGLAQGIFLYLILEAWQKASWPATQPLLFTPLFLIAVFVPALLISSLGHFERKQLAAWSGTAMLVVVLLGTYGVWRMGGQPDQSPGSPPPMPWAPLTAVLVPWFFIAHALVMAGVRDRRRLASYPGYFEVAWKLMVQLAFSGLFVGVLWLVLTLGAQMFLLVRLDFLAELLPKRWFALPVTAMAWSCAMHVTDVRPAIVSNIRNLLLSLLSWILPVMTLLVGGFVLSLPFTGLAPLWATRHAASLLLVAAGVFVVLINAAWQDGAQALAEAALPVRLSARIAALLLVPVTAIAGYALALRVGDYGWTSERVIAAACVLVATCYALGYAAAALRGATLAIIAQVNIATALVVLATGVALLSPLADPVRLAVNSQVARLESGKVAIDKFDFGWLRFQGERYGIDALARLESNARGPQAPLLRERIAQARELRRPSNQSDEMLPQPDLAANIRLWPKGTSLPASFMHENWQKVGSMVNLPDCLRKAGKACDAMLLDLTGDGKPEVLLVGSSPFSIDVLALQETAQGHWKVAGISGMHPAGCTSLAEAVRTGNVHVAKPELQDIEVAGMHLQLTRPGPASIECPKPRTAAPSPAR